MQTGSAKAHKGQGKDIMKSFNNSIEMAEAYAAENSINLLSAIAFIKDVSASYFEAKTGIKAHQPVMFYIPNYGYVGEAN